MSMHIGYVVDGQDEPIDGDILGSALGWNAWCEAVSERGDSMPEAVHLADEAWLEPEESLDALAAELEAADDLPPNAAGVSARLLAALRERPEGCVGLVVTDGTVEG